MYGFHDVLSLSITATSAVAKETLVTFDGDTAGADEPVFGWAKNDEAVGREVACVALGVVPVRAVGAIAKGVRVVSAAGGKVTTALAGAVNPCGRSLNAAADGAIALIFLTPR